MIFFKNKERKKVKKIKWSTCLSVAALSALFKVDGALRRVGGENDYVYYAGNRRIHKILIK